MLYNAVKLSIKDPSMNVYNHFLFLYFKNHATLPTQKRLK